MRISLKSTAMGLAAFGALAIAAPSAWAGCAAEPAKSPAVYEKVAPDGAQLIRVANGPTIVGLWAIELWVGQQRIDFGYSEWHSDGTEIMNSGGHPASTGNFCLGAWTQTGGQSYRLNHFALAYDPTAWQSSTGGLIARINLKEEVALGAGGNEFSGVFSQDGYDPVTNTLIPAFHATGRIVGHRINP